MRRDDDITLNDRVVDSIDHWIHTEGEQMLVVLRIDLDTGQRETLRVCQPSYLWSHFGAESPCGFPWSQ